MVLREKVDYRRGQIDEGCECQRGITPHCEWNTSEWWHSGLFCLFSAHGTLQRILKNKGFPSLLPCARVEITDI